MGRKPTRTPFEVIADLCAFAEDVAQLAAQYDLPALLNAADSAKRIAKFQSELSKEQPKAARRRGRPRKNVQMAPFDFKNTVPCNGESVEDEIA